MPVKTVIDKAIWKTMLQTVLINGAPYTGKTQSLMTFPAPRHIVVAPGEFGSTTILPDNKDTFLYYWEYDSQGQLNPVVALSEYEQLIKEIITGKRGPVATLAQDGLHKLYTLVMKASGWTPDTDPREFGRYHDRFSSIIKVVNGSKVPYRVATVYDGPEVVDTTAEKKESKIYPSLPGKQAKEIMGEFPVCFHSLTFGQGKAKKYLWQLETTDSVRGAGVHLPKEMTAKLPATLTQDWNEFEKIINAILI